MRINGGKKEKNCRRRSNMNKKVYLAINNAKNIFDGVVYSNKIVG
jgi:hypothetical protein